MSATVGGASDVRAQTRVEGAPPHVTTAEGRRAARISARQAAADERYGVRSHGGGRFSADQADMRLRTHFAPGMVAVTPWATMNDRAAPSLNLAVAAWGCEGELRSVAEVAPARMTASANRVELAHDGLTEWYTNGPAGIEQGFIVGELPTCDHAADKLLVRLSKSQGWRAAIAPAGRGVVFRGPRGAEIHYGELYAEDAKGRLLPARFSERAGAVEIELDTTGATAPILIDPLAWKEQQRFDVGSHSVGLSGALAILGDAPSTTLRTGGVWAPLDLLVSPDTGKLTFPVAISEGTALVSGGPANKTYVFVRSGSSWSSQQVLPTRGSVMALMTDSPLLDDSVLLTQAGSHAADWYKRKGSVWALANTLDDFTTCDEQGRACTKFGCSAAFDHNQLALVGVCDGWGAKKNTGVVVVYVDHGDSWDFSHYLSAPDLVTAGAFGTFVSASMDGSVLVGAPTAPDGGKAYIFAGSTFETTFAGSGAAGFGSAGALSKDGTIALVGASRDADAGTQAGAVHVFTKTDGTWSEEPKLLAGDALANDRFGQAVSIDGDYAVVGSTRATYLFHRGLTDGSACSADSQCVSDICSIEGVCCDDECVDGCSSCLAARNVVGTDGVCEAVKPATDPRNGCAKTSCASGFCDGAGACTNLDVGSECSTATCAATSSLNPPDTCDGLGVCTATPALPCPDGYACAAGACKTSCATSSDCDEVAGYRCRDNACSKGTLADSCASDAECGSGHCSPVDQICCDKACGGTCESCLAAKRGGGVDGMCGTIAEDIDPDNECDSTGNSCGPSGLCDGAGNCRASAKPQTPCGETTCADPEHVQGQLCDGSGVCGTAKVACAPYVCSGAVCSTDCEKSSDCAASAFCNSAGHCQDQLENGAECQAGDECSSRNCVDGFCCNVACQGQCEYCAAAGTEGKCLAVKGKPFGEREQCPAAAADAPCEATSCDGRTRDACAGLADDSVKCAAATCDDFLATAESYCDGAGVCQIGRVDSCGGYACGSDACLTACSTDTQCADGYRCARAKCAPAGAHCSEDLSSSAGPDGETACAPYLCDVATGACLTSCAESTECTAAHVCNTEAKLCETPAGKPDEDGGCACKMTSGRTSNVFAAGLLGLLALVRRRGSRRERLAFGSSMSIR